jgi:hypothetical protein
MSLDPIRLDTAGDQIIGPLEVVALVWSGATTQADSCVLKAINGEEVWRGHTDVANTYMGINFSPEGLRFEEGVELQSISAGDLYVYIRLT